MRRRIFHKWFPDHRFGGHFDQVNSHNFRNKGERSRGSDIALDDLDLVVLGNELNIKRACDIESVCDLGCSLFKSSDSLRVQIMRRKDQSSVTRVDTGILYMLGNKMANH